MRKLRPNALFLLLLIALTACATQPLWAHRRGRARDPSLPVSFDDILDAGVLATLVFFALSYFNPQYSILLVCMVILRLHRMPESGPAHALQLVGRRPNPERISSPSRRRPRTQRPIPGSRTFRSTSPAPGRGRRRRSRG